MPSTSEYRTDGTVLPYTTAMGGYSSDSSYSNESRNSVVRFNVRHRYLYASSNEMANLVCCFTCNGTGWPASWARRIELTIGLRLYSIQFLGSKKSTLYNSPVFLSLNSSPLRGMNTNDDRIMKLTSEVSRSLHSRMWSANRSGPMILAHGAGVPTASILLSWSFVTSSNSRASSSVEIDSCRDSLALISSRWSSFSSDSSFSRPALSTDRSDDSRLCLDGPFEPNGNENEKIFCVEKLSPGVSSLSRSSESTPAGLPPMMDDSTSV
ncbi:hypothetical protein OGAPHI_005345 [Ogataea philodendri]|uniref:Uncharacterized protein n=1 Tax=Ogataea philodendri TaxID=1378263 RepID=A0A9P8P1E8_9ASCO|nr:uncharacterized protein OGAPHI_005345 [Ogataea philodendri]KAH3663355.1 hypothetical protein OGAPHI_005345 [Ogataea philodendri]